MPLLRSFLSLLLAVTLLAGAAQAALLDVGPKVPQVLGSTEPNLKHGFPLWYRDSNRLPLELCMDPDMCFFAPPNPAAAVSFPGNMPDEAFWWAGESIINLPGVNQKAILVQALEAAFSTGDVVPDKQVSFARMRIRIDTPVAGTYNVTTPFKQFTFTVAADAIADGINFTEDIGIAEGGVFTGALAGSLGPFLYCTNAPVTGPNGGSFLGDGVPCPVLGSTFPDPLHPGQFANLFRIEGPVGADLDGLGNNMVESGLFSINGKIHTDPIPTPLTVNQATYALDALGLRVNAFATTQAISNQTGTGAFPLNFTLKGVPSVLQLSAAGMTQAMTTNNPGDGKFFSASGRLTATPPATVTVTNITDIPETVVQNVPLVDEVVISAAAYNPLTNALAITASSSDKLNAPILQVFLPGMSAPLGTLANGVLNVAFPVTDTTVTPNKTYAIPSSTITVTSAKGGLATALISTFAPAVLPATGATLLPGVASPQTAITPVTFTAAATGGDSGPYEYRFQWRPATSPTYTNGRAYSTTPTWTWDTATLGLTPGTYIVRVYARHVGSTVAAGEAIQTLTYSLTTAAPATGVTLTAGVATPQPAGTAVTFAAAATGGDAGPYEYRFLWRASTSATYTNGRTFSTTPTWNWDTAALGLTPGTYIVRVYARHVGSAVTSEALQTMIYVLN